MMTEGFDLLPYHVERFPLGACVCNRNGFNCLALGGGAKFTTMERAEEICAQWNGETK